MAKKYILTLRPGASPHLFLDDIKRLIENDKILYPQTRKMLLLLKRTKMAFIQLPLQMEVIVAPSYNANFERALSPALLNYSKTDWNETDINKFKNTPQTFYRDMLKFYSLMGYDLQESNIDIDIVNKINSDIELHKKELEAKKNGKSNRKMEE